MLEGLEELVRMASRVDLNDLDEEAYARSPVFARGLERPSPRVGTVNLPSSRGPNLSGSRAIIGADDNDGSIERVRKTEHFEQAASLASRNRMAIRTVVTAVCHRCCGLRVGGSLP